MSTSVLETIHGSHLYGLAHASSDVDSYLVLLEPKGFAKQVKHGDDDSLVISLDRFVEQIGLGVPQALEALWSPVAEIPREWRPFLSSLQPGRSDTIQRFRRTIVNFALCRGGRTGAAARQISQVKLHRHALRLLLELEDFCEHGHFSPTLTPDRVGWVKKTAEMESFEELLMPRVLSCY